MGLSLGDVTGAVTGGLVGGPVGGFVGGLNLGGKLLGEAGLTGAADEGGAAVAAATKKAVEEQRRQFNINRQDLAPIREIELNSLRQLQERLKQGQGNVPTFNPVAPGVTQFDPGAAFSFDPTEILNDPSVQARLELGGQALDRSLAHAGKRNSGQRLTDALRFGQAIASEELQNAFNRNLTTSRENFNRNLQTFGTNFDANNQLYNRGLSTFNTQLDLSNNRFERENTLRNTLLALGNRGQTTSNLANLRANLANNVGQLKVGGAEAIAAGKLGEQQTRLNLLGDIIGGGSRIIAGGMKPA